MKAHANEQIKKYMEYLKSEVGELEVCFQKGATIEELLVASSGVILAAAQVEEVMVQSLAAGRKNITSQNQSCNSKGPESAGEAHAHANMRPISFSASGYIFSSEMQHYESNCTLGLGSQMVEKSWVSKR